MSAQKVMSLVDVFPGKTITIPVTEDDLLFAVDLVMIIHGGDRTNASKVNAIRLSDSVTQLIILICQVLARISPDNFDPEHYILRQITSGHKTKLLKPQDSIQLVMCLPGTNAKKLRAGFATLMHRYLAGDKSLIKEINANAASSSTVAQMAKASLGGPAMGGGFQPIPDVMAVVPLEVPLFSADPEIERDQMTHFRSRLQYAYEKTVRTSKAQIQKAAFLDDAQARLHSTKEAVDARFAEIEWKRRDFDTRNAKLNSAKTAVDNRAVELDAVKAALETRDAIMNRRAEALDVRTGDLETREANMDRRAEALDVRTSDLETREAQLVARQTEVLRALSRESDKNLALLEARKAEVEATAMENDAKVKQIGEELDKRDAELKKRAAELDIPVVVAEEVQAGRKRSREVDFSLVTQMAEELKKINGGELDLETKQELKQRLFDMLERAGQ